MTPGGMSDGSATRDEGERPGGDGPPGALRLVLGVGLAQIVVSAVYLVLTLSDPDALADTLREVGLRSLATDTAATVTAVVLFVVGNGLWLLLLALLRRGGRNWVWWVLAVLNVLTIPGEITRLTGGDLVALVDLALAIALIFGLKDQGVRAWSAGRAQPDVAGRSTA